MIGRPSEFSGRGLAVVDLYGARGTAARRWAVLVELPVGALTGVVLGVFLLGQGGATGWIGGSWVLGVGLNYLSLSVHALQVRRPERLEAEIRLLDDLDAARRYYSVAQVRLLIPGWLLFVDLAHRRPWT
ncbi:MAG TPA: hypothetical protein VGN18_12890 [Jatrophihabitans sp.]|jgi:hypothetical protein|uniref:hypothetical protein n=1 Tax=Jatrophihabitans sp. TaxID=1932789 RepID=UPI002E045121|nr:hypothetical protein [Jatrophihabitans sp.]